MILALLSVLGTACAEPLSCEEQLYEIARDWSAELGKLDRTCTVDADCTLVDKDLSCVEFSERAVVNTASVSRVVDLRPAYELRCPACNGSFDGLRIPIGVACTAGVCVARYMNDP